MFRRKVKAGSRTGRQIGFPTLNFNVGSFAECYSPGVYACQVRIGQKNYRGALYFGPKMNHCGRVLEVFVIAFSWRIYGAWVRLQIGKKIRNPKKMNDLDSLKKQIKKDLESVV